MELGAFFELGEVLADGCELLVKVLFSKTFWKCVLAVVVTVGLIALCIHVF